MHYTPAQTRWFLAAIDAEEVDRHKADLIAARYANAGKDAFAKYFERLSSKR